MRSFDTEQHPEKKRCQKIEKVGQPAIQLQAVLTGGQEGEIDGEGYRSLVRRKTLHLSSRA